MTRPVEVKINHLGLTPRTPFDQDKREYERYYECIFTANRSGEKTVYLMHYLDPKMIAKLGPEELKQYLLRHLRAASRIIEPEEFRS